MRMDGKITEGLWLFTIFLLPGFILFACVILILVMDQIGG